MCTSLRGASYYGASLHISVALLFLGGFFIDLLGISEVWHNPYATYFSLILAFIYICLFFVFGLLIFRGVELESAKLLKGAIAGLLVLQLSAFLVYLALTALTHSRKKAEHARKLEDQLILNRLPPGIKNISSLEPESTIATILGIGIGIGGDTTGENPDLDLDFSSSESDESDNDKESRGGGGDIPIITLLQIISLVFGIISTVGYVAVVVLYVRSISPGRRT